MFLQLVFRDVELLDEVAAGVGLAGVAAAGEQVGQQGLEDAGARGRPGPLPVRLTVARARSSGRGVGASPAPALAHLAQRSGSAPAKLVRLDGTRAPIT